MLVFDSCLNSLFGFFNIPTSLDASMHSLYFMLRRDIKQWTVFPFSILGALSSTFAADYKRLGRLIYFLNCTFSIILVIVDIKIVARIGGKSILIPLYRRVVIIDNRSD